MEQVAVMLARTVSPERPHDLAVSRPSDALAARAAAAGTFTTLLLSALGGVAGLALGGLVTAGYALWQGWPPTVPAWVPAGAFAATLAVGAIAGIYPAIRASHLPPTVALASS
ncbi:hypothetical protein [Nonomuraea sp. NPDC049758]|uniref:ABC transporter permease n=1 Tax=Nonomuraea sp. NPDC049758 TaxID=3154360 RepID=UPI0034222CAE